MATILTIEDEENLRLSIRRTLEKAGHRVHEASNLTDARARLEDADFDLILTDVILGGENGLDLVRELRRDEYHGIVVVMTAFGTVESAVEAMKEGADDYLQKPLSLEELSLQVDKWLRHRRLATRVKLYERLERTRADDNELAGDSPAWLETKRLAERLAQIPLNSGAEGESLPSILLLGETGVGKGVLARYIHDCATAAVTGDVKPPFVHVNCSALPATLVEGELFGHEKGAFTDAREKREGLFEMADGGTIFLDEISEMPLELQSKLLIAVEHGTFRRVGGTKERHVHARVIAASNQDLAQRVGEGGFRQDLLYRLNTFTIQIPALRERDDDANAIAEHVLARAMRNYNRSDLVLTPEARDAIRTHNWPGNVRELVNAVQRAAMLAADPNITQSDLGLAPQAAPSEQPPSKIDGPLRFDFEDGIHTADEVEKTLMMQALERTRGNISQAAKLIGMQRSSFRYRIDRYGLDDFVVELARQ